MRALLLTHGNLGQALLDSASQIYAVDAPVDVLSNEGRGTEELQKEIQRWLAVDEGPVILLVDVGGGSCGIAARLAARHRADCWILGGVNLPMVLTYLSSHAQLGPEDLVSKLLDRSLNAVRNLDDEG